MKPFPSKRLWWCLLPLVISSVLCLCVDPVWEDYYITLRSSLNLVLGEGLVYNVGDRLHTFTSPLGVLIPAFCVWLSGVGNDVVALALFRGISALFLLGSALLLLHASLRLDLGKPSLALALGLTFLDMKLTCFSMAGMETAFLVFFVLLLWATLESPDGICVWRLALAVGGLMWSRPDAFILGLALILPSIWSRVWGHSFELRRAWSLCKPVAAGILLGGALYAPWFIWAWWYYGSPIPHTIVAKANFAPALDFQSIFLLPWNLLVGRSGLEDVVLPSYVMFGGWPSFIITLSKGMIGLAALLCLFPCFSGPTRRLSFAVLFGGVYMSLIPLFPWYIPPWATLAYLCLAFALNDASKWPLLRVSKLSGSFIRIGVGAALSLQACIWSASAWQLSCRQRIVETKVRKAVGLYLSQEAKPGETVFMECLGYIGYFSKLKTIDLPGLSSREVVEAVKQGIRSYSGIVEHFRPDWVAVRPQEQTRMVDLPCFKEYELVKVWDVSEELSSIKYLPGRAWLEWDQTFLLYHRRSKAHSP